MRRVDIFDSGFLYIESRETPMHVGSVNLFQFPKGANRSAFMRRLGDAYRSARQFRRPFGEFVTTGRLGPAGPYYWKKDTELDLDYHVRHSALPGPGRYLELFSLVSRLHSTLLDRSRPLWEVHLIEGLQNRQFAVYSKLHHATIDGVAGIRLTEGMCSTDADERIEHSPLSLEAYEKFKATRAAGREVRSAASRQDLRNIAELLKAQLDSSANLLDLLQTHAKTWLGFGDHVALPWHHVPKTLINSHVSGARRFVAQSWRIERVKRISRSLGCTLNDVVLGMCAGALRRYLLAHHDLPVRSLRAMVPVSVRAADDFDSANSVSFITANLGTAYADPADRMNVIIQSTRAGKDMISGLSGREASLYAGISQLPLLLSSLLGLAERFPAFSTTISNVPGPREALYWNGAPLIGIYPASAIFHGFALNITLVGYHEHLDFGIVACRRSVPQVQRLIDYLEDALTELEEMAGV